MALSTTLLAPAHTPPATPPGVLGACADLELLETGQELLRDAQGRPTDQVGLLWFHNREREAGRVYDVYRAARLFAVTFLPQEKRQDAAFKDRMRTALTGLYNQRTAQFDILHLFAGMWEPHPIGIVQIYGVVGLGDALAAARRHADLGAAALLATLNAAFEQARFEPLRLAQWEWLINAYHQMHFGAVVVGQPDERQNPKGQGREGPGEQKQQTPEGAQVGQQSEMFLRAMVQGKHQFVAPLLASRVAPAELARQVAGLADEASVFASLQTGSEGISASLALPLGLSANSGWMSGQAFGRTRGESVSQTVSVSTGRAHTVGRATTVGHSITEGESHSTGVAHSSGGSITRTTSISEGTGQATGTAQTTGTAHSSGVAHSSGSFSSSSSSSGISGGVNGSINRGVAKTDGVADSTNWGTANSETNTVTGTSGMAQAESWGDARAFSRQVGGSVGGNYGRSTTGSLNPGGVGVSGGSNWGVSGSLNASVGETNTDSIGGSTTYSGSLSNANAVGTTDSVGGAHTTNNSVTNSGGVSSGWSSGWSHSTGVSSGSSASTTTSSSDTTSQSQTNSQSNSTSQGISTSTAVGSFSSSTTSESHGTSRAETHSTATTQSTADSTSEGTSHGISSGRSVAESAGRTAGQSQGLGMSMGAVAGLGYSNSSQWFDDQAILLTNILRAQTALADLGSREGAYLTDLYILTETEAGLAAAEASVRQAYQGNGPLVITPVQTRRLSPSEQAYIRLHALCCTPSTRPETKKATYEPYRDATLLTARQLAAYTAPAMFEEGLAVTVQEQFPAFAFYPDLPGEVVWAHQFSTETGQLTDTPLRVSRDRFFHTAFCADTGFGKSVAAERLALEAGKAWHQRIVVLDFGAGWRKLLFAPGLRDRVAIYQLQPGATVPLRWNPWQVGQRINAEQQLLATCEIFQRAGRMGDRQLGYMVTAATQLWTVTGVLTNSTPVLQHPRWGYVQPDEWDVLETAWQTYQLPPRARGRVAVQQLAPPERQALAVWRSRDTGLQHWIAILEEILRGRWNAQKQEFVGGKKVGSPDYVSLEGLLLRLQMFQMGDMARLYAPGPDTVPIEDLGLLGDPLDPWGITILEGGSSMPEYPKAVIMGLVAWHLYNDAKARRQERINTGQTFPTTVIVFEEANKILTGVDTGMSDGPQGPTTSARFQEIFRDGRKYDFFAWLLVQSPAELPPGLFSSCNNLVIGQLKAAADRDIAQAGLGWSEKGFTDEDYKRAISRLPIGYAIVKLGYTANPVWSMPVLARPIMVAAREPTDLEVWMNHQVLTGVQP